MTSRHIRAGVRARHGLLGKRRLRLWGSNRSDEQARKLPLARIIAAGPPADSGITLAAWPSWYECEFFACPRRGTTCADPKCKIGSACLAMREIGLDGNGGPLRRRERPKCGARNRQGEPCAVRVEPGKARCRFHGGLSTGPRTIEGRARVAEAQRQRWARTLGHHVGDEGNYTAAAQAALREKKRETRRILEIERRKFRELPEEWADRAFLAGLRQR
jgi:hypothetical protein